MSIVNVSITSEEQAVTILVQDVVAGEGPVTIQVAELTPQPPVNVTVSDVAIGSGGTDPALVGRVAALEKQAEKTILTIKTDW